MMGKSATPHRRRKRARILPTLAILFLGASALRLAAGVNEALAQNSEPPIQASLAPAPDTGTLSAGSDIVSNVDLSLEIRRRERAVDAREASVAEREAIFAALESRVQAQVRALEAAETELAATMALADSAAEDDILRLVSVFEVMKPEDAASLFAEMDPGFAAGFLARLTPGATAAILAGMEPRQAYAMTALIAGRNALVPRE